MIPSPIFPQRAEQRPAQRPALRRKRVDEHIGKGAIGLTGFRLLMNDERFIRIPQILETPKSDDLHEDVENSNPKELCGGIDSFLKQRDITPLRDEENAISKRAGIISTDLSTFRLVC